MLVFVSDATPCDCDCDCGGLGAKSVFVQTTLSLRKVRSGQVRSDAQTEDVDSGS